MDGIAAAVGCSRAHLYRVFASHERTVAGDLRQVAAPGQATDRDGARPTDRDIAFECSFTDPTAFGKAFRRRYGCSRSDRRATANAGGPRM